MTDELRHEISDILGDMAFRLSHEDPTHKERLGIAVDLKDIAFTVEHTEHGPF